MRKWEEEYEKYKNGEMNSEIEELKQKVDDKTANKEEFNKYEKMSKVKNNLYKVDNIVEFKKILKEDLTKIQDELATREILSNANKEKEKLESEMNSMLAKKDEINKELKDKDLTDEKRAELNKDLKGIDDKIGKNNENFMKNQSVFEKYNGRNENELTKLDDKELTNRGIMLSSQISKCNMAAKSLVNGLSWDSIEIKLDNWKDRKFTSKSKVAENVRTEKDMEIDKDRIFKDIDRTLNADKYKEIYSDSEHEKAKEAEKVRTEKEELGMTEQSEFAKKHPRLAKIANWFKEKTSKIFNINTDVEVDSPKPNIDPIAKAPEAKKESKQEVDFKEYLKDIAEKGYKGVEKDNLEAQSKKLEERRKQFKEEAYKREQAKFGKDYAEMSKEDSEER